MNIQNKADQLVKYQDEFWRMHNSLKDNTLSLLNELTDLLNDINKLIPEIVTYTDNINNTINQLIKDKDKGLFRTNALAHKNDKRYTEYRRSIDNSIKNIMELLPQKEIVRTLDENKNALESLEKIKLKMQDYTIKNALDLLTDAKNARHITDVNFKEFIPLNRTEFCFADFDSFGKYLGLLSDAAEQFSKYKKPPRNQLESFGEYKLKIIYNLDSIIDYLRTKTTPL